MFHASESFSVSGYAFEKKKKKKKSLVLCRT